MRQDKDKQLLLDRLKETPIIEFACKKIGIGRATYYRWREDKEFAKSADGAIAEGEAFITDMSESQLISMIRDRNFQAIQLWLRHHHSKYSQKIEITANISQQDELTPEQETVVREALRLASLLPEEESK
ncbi:MAG: phBC6A51 family helix-turn-helix protein [Minisyncoccales bacterium]